MRKPGGRLLGLAQSLGLGRLGQTVLLPAVADLQHEYPLAETRRARALTLARGYWSILAAVTWYAALLPSRHLRENWAGPDAPGPRLLRRAALPAGIIAASCYAYVGFMLATSTDADWHVPAFALPVLLTNMGVMVTPPALGAGLGWVLARDRSGARAALLIGLLGVAFSFLFYDQAVTRAVHTSRVAAAASAKTPQSYMGSDLTFTDLGAAISSGEADAAARSSRRCTCANGTAALLRSEWHMRLSMPAFAVSFVIFAGALARTGRRLAVIAGLWPGYVATIWVLKSSVSYSLRGEIPIALAAWGPHLLPLCLAGLVLAMTARGTEAYPRTVSI